MAANHIVQSANMNTLLHQLSKIFFVKKVFNSKKEKFLVYVFSLNRFLVLPMPLTYPDALKPQRENIILFKPYKEKIGFVKKRKEDQEHKEDENIRKLNPLKGFWSFHEKIVKIKKTKNLKKFKKRK